MKGASTVYVKVPLIGAEAQKLRMYWHLRPGQAAPEHYPETIWSDWTEEDAAAAGQPSSEFGLVNKDGVWVNYFTREPAMDKQNWSAGETPGKVTVLAELAEGDVAVAVIDASETVLSTDPEVLPTAPGTYRIIFKPDAPDGEYEPVVRNLDFSIYGTLPFDDLSGGLTGADALTLNGRVMLANDDAAAGHAVVGQAYWRTREVETSPGVTNLYNLYWTHEDAEKPVKNEDSLNFLAGGKHRLNFIGADGSTNVLWRLDNVIIGNGRPKTGAPYDVQAVLPCSPTSLGNSSYAKRDVQGSEAESGNLIMRNMIGVTVYSPCYTNGIGTIYFDALNSYIDDGNVSVATNYQIVVEIATNTVSGLPPTDENAVDGSGGLGNIETWTPCEMLPLKRDGGADFAAQAKTNELSLGIKTGKSNANFYRVCVPLNITGPVRFRIRRTNNYGYFNEDQGGGLILLDNIIVSYPACKASMVPYGKYDGSRGGKQVLGQEGAMANVPFPSVTSADNLIARGQLVSYVSPVTDVSAETFVQSATFHYRWRYLGQAFDPAGGKLWKSVSLSPFDEFKASEPLKVPSEPGDIEFWYELKTMMPFYDYYDYSGSGAKLGGLYTEETTAVTNRMDTNGYKLPSEGSDWFVRLREGESDFETVRVVLAGVPSAYSANQEMELVSDHTWRGLVRVPSNTVSGAVSFLFRRENRQDAGATSFVMNQTTLYPTADVDRFPWRGEVKTSGEMHKYEADGASTYLEFTYNDASETYSIGHASYQNFNAWHDANVPGTQKFVGTYTEVSGVTTATMVQTNADMLSWSPLVTEKKEWNEPFDLYPNYLDPGYPKGEFLGTHKMPGPWNGSNGMFVDAQLTTSNLVQYMENSGIAWQMQGEESGDMSYTQGSGPTGLDTVSFKARLGQSISFDDFSVWYGDGSSSTNEYTVVVPALLSSAEKTMDYAPGASMSIVSYYLPKVGCYELRIERNFSDGIQISIYKWSVKKYKITSELLTTRFFKNAKFSHDEGVKKPSLYAMVLSVGVDNNETVVIGGLTTASAQPSASYSGVTYNLVCCKDKDNPLKKGGYGVLPANCNGVFLQPRQYSSRLTKSAIAEGGADYKAFYESRKVTLVGNYDNSAPYYPCRTRLTDAWAYTPGRTEMFEESNAAYNYQMLPRALGIRAPADLDQTVDVFLKPRSGSSSSWELVDSVKVSSYAFTQHSVAVRTNESCHVMLKAGEAPVDVTVWDIKQTAWNGEDIGNIAGRTHSFVYTQARVIEEVQGVVTNHVTMLQPARAVASKALSIRSPLLYGLGMIGFSYKDVKPGCEVWVQAATNAVAGNLSGTIDNYNFSTNSVELGEVEEVGEWITLRRYSYEELASAKAQTYYCGWHTHANDPLEGMFRVVIAPDVVTAAQAKAKTDPEWGSITITDVLVHDEPAIDETSWLGWNLRTLGDDKDTERRMFLADSSAVKSESETSYGMSAGLNNSTTADINGDPSEYDKINPTIQSPTFGTYTTSEGRQRKATIGLVRLRARLYETNTASHAVGKLSLYGVKDGASENWGTALTNFTVDSFVYRTFEYRASSLDDFAAIRLVVDGVTNTPPVSGVQRVLLDEVVVSERAKASVGFAYARPFRTGLAVDKLITNILDKDQQPLTEESWGIQAKLKFDKYDAEIDTNKGFRVYFRYFVGESPWGCSRWESESGASEWAELRQVGEPGDYVFRSTVADKKTVVPSQTAANTVVQYTLRVDYYLAGVAEPQPQEIELGTEEGDGWTNPLWYEPVDYNKDQFHGNGDPELFSPYTILDAVSPGRVWINEVNYCDGPKAQTGGAKCVTNQFVELAVPWGVDLKGWKVVLTDMNHRSLTIAELGKNGVPSSKKTTRRSGDYDFLVLQSPDTRDAGGIKDYMTGEPIADGTWVAETLPSTFKAGQLQYDEPYQFELYRPSGILEHQFVVAGTNEWREPLIYYELFGYTYDGTNLVQELNDLDAAAGRSYARRFYAGEDLARKENGVVWSSLGVAGEAHGEDGGWSSEMRFTPGRLNEGQEELTGWYLKPYGASIWVYAKSLSGHIVQSIGDDTLQDTFVIVNSGESTNVNYTIAPWYSIGALSVNGVTNSALTGITGSYELNLNNITETTYVVVSEGIDPMLLDAGLDPADPYTPAVLNWLTRRYYDGELANPDGPISLGHHKGLNQSDAAYEMPLKVMYWLDIDPTNPGWWLRHGFTGIAGEEVRRKRKWNDSYTEHLTNRLVTVKMYLSNDVSHVVRKLTRLQGLGNERSDEYTGNWTSETFKVQLMLNNGLPHNAGFLPFRWFTFGPSSFSDDFEAKIEILDPFSRSSAGYPYGWYKNSCNSLLYRFTFDDSLETWAQINLLKADSTYDGPPFEDDD